MKAFRKVLAGLVAGTLLCLAQIPAEAYTLTPEAEYRAGEGLAKWHPPRIDNLWLKTILWYIIDRNPDRLRWATDSNTRGIVDCSMGYTKGKFMNSVCLPGGRIIVYDGLIEAMTTRDVEGGNVLSGKVTPLSDASSIYGTSAVAIVIAHECVHWEQNSLQGIIDTMFPLLSADTRKKLIYEAEHGDGLCRQMDMVSTSENVSPALSKFIYNSEEAADKGSLELVMNCNIFSPGSLITAAEILGGGDDAKAPHPTKEKRIKMGKDYIARISGGRIRLDSEDRMSIDGKLFMGTGYMPERDDVNKKNRTLYVAGQLAKSLCQHHDTMVLGGARAFRDFNGHVVMMSYVKGSSADGTVIDIFDLTINDEREIYAGKKKKNPEYKALTTLRNFLLHEGMKEKKLPLEENR